MSKKPEDINVAPGIVAHPHVCSGTPCVQGRRIGTKWIVGRFYGGDTVSHLAEDYSLPVEVVEQAIRYEYIRRCSREPEMRAIFRGGKSVLVTDREAQRMWKKSANISK